ncbi:MAG: hypothetical protein E6R03_13455 [Hyphomicrobiaceae bacterium]|nr:MAG: hypothetical protein E6R03_13455 [Hyphomicrobiaceae bacterium]
METVVHKFEAAGLGKAPFRFVGIEEKRGPIRYTDKATGLEMEVGAPGQPMGTCEYCGQGIAICCTVRSADGKTFIVGSDCIAKVGDAGLKKLVDTKVRQRTKATEESRIENMRNLLADDSLRAKMSALPSPSKFGTMLTWADWMMKNAGHTGRMRVVRAVEKLI